MRSWKRRTQYQYKDRYRIWNESDVEHDHVSKWAKRRFPNKYTGLWEGWGHPSWRKQQNRRDKRTIRVVSDGLAQFSKYPYFEDCRYHPCRVTQLSPDREGGRLDIEGESLINNTPCACSYFHCGIVHLTEEEGLERASFAIDKGMLPYRLKYVNEKGGDLISFIRYDYGLEEQFGFCKNSKVEYVTEAGWMWLILEHGIDFKTLTPMSDEEMKIHSGG